MEREEDWSGASLKMSPFPSPRLFAGRGRVRGLGEWPHLFNYAPILQMTICSTE